MKKQKDVLIIGGGVIGVCIAYYLLKQGRTVTILERDEICAGCSYGNAGLIVPGHSLPLPMPGVLAKGVKWMFDVESPFYIKPRFDPTLLAWLWRFQAACREAPMRQAIELLRDLNQTSATLFKQIITEEQLSCHYDNNGSLRLFRTHHSFEEGLTEAALLREYGLSSRALTAEAVQKMVPGVHPAVTAGIHFPEDAHLDPAKFVRGLAAVVQEQGGMIQTDTEVLGFETLGRNIVGVKTTRGDFKAQEVILAGGVWSSGMVGSLGLKLPIQPAKGYSLLVQRPATYPDVPLMLGETKVVTTPLGPLMRLAGTLELAGFDMSINRRRVEAIRRSASSYLTGLEGAEPVEIWRGLRPCTPDGLPVIGRPAAYDNLIIAAGHAMLGVSLGPVTGQMVAQVACGQAPTLDLAALRLERFG